jgi:hypothetical protein
MTDQVVQAKSTVSDDPWEVADSAKPRDYEYYGQVQADVWFAYFPGGGAKPIPFDPTQHPIDKRVTQIEIHIIPVPEQNVTFDVHQNYSDFSPDWTKITLPSIKALGFDGLRSLNGHWVRVAQVDGKRKKLDKDTKAETGEYWSTFKFLEVYPDQAACEHAYSGARSLSPDTEQQSAPEANGDAEKITALKFAKVVVENKAKGQTDKQAVIAAVTEAIAGMPMIAKYFTGSSPDILGMINEVMKS